MRHIVGVTWHCITGAEGSAQFPFAPAICPASERILEDSLDVPGGFLERQRHFHDLRQRRLRLIQAEVSLSWAQCLGCIHASCGKVNIPRDQNHAACRHPFGS